MAVMCRQPLLSAAGLSRGIYVLEATLLDVGVLGDAEVQETRRLSAALRSLQRFLTISMSLRLEEVNFNSKVGLHGPASQLREPCQIVRAWTGRMFGGLW